MTTTKASVWETDTAKRLATTLAAISDVDVMQKFLRDVLTEKEIIEISSRLQAAKMLQQGRKYTEIVEKTKLSSRTVARISSWMQDGCGGYAAALDLNDSYHTHI